MASAVAHGIGREPMRNAGIGVEVLLAYGISALVSLRIFVSDMHVGTLVALALLPVTLGIVGKFRGATVLLALAVLSAGASVLLTFASAADHQTSDRLMWANTVLILGIGVSVITLLWARTVIGLTNMTLAYGLGAFASVVIKGLHPENPWKFSLALPTILVVLSLPFVARSLVRQTAALLVVAGVSVVTDARSLSATLLIAAGLLLTRRRAHTGNRTSAWTVAGQIVLIAVGAFYALQAAILEGVLGEQIQLRTLRQIEDSGNVLAGGRPELGASVALLSNNPFGYGSGTRPSYRDILVAKAGMAQLGYDPNNGYVHRYMFGTGFEVHSVFGDLWLMAGLAGLLLGCAALFLILGGMAQSIARGTAVGVALFLGGLSVWNLLFSPILTSFFALVPCLAAVLQPRRDPG